MNRAEELKLAYNTVSSCINKMIELNIIRKSTKRARNRVFKYAKYVEILKRGTEI